MEATGIQRMNIMGLCEVLSRLVQHEALKIGLASGDLIRKELACELAKRHASALWKYTKYEAATVVA